MLLDYIALAMLIVGALLVFYTFIYIHDLPHKIAKQRGHPHVDAIHVACWLSLLTLHAIWPLVFIWSLTKQDTSLIASPGSSGSSPETNDDGSNLVDHVRALEERIAAVERKQQAGE